MTIDNGEGAEVRFRGGEAIVRVGGKQMQPSREDALLDMRRNKRKRESRPRLTYGEAEGIALGLQRAADGIAELWDAMRVYEKRTGNEITLPNDALFEWAGDYAGGRPSVLEDAIQYVRMALRFEGR